MEGKILQDLFHQYFLNSLIIQSFVLGNVGLVHVS